MATRSDATLAYLLRYILNRCESENTKRCVNAALSYMDSAISPYRGGRALISLLREAADVVVTSDPGLVVPLADAIAYAEGREFKNDIEDRYDLFGHGHRSSIDTRYTARMAWLSIEYCLGEVADHLREEPDAVLADVIHYLEKLKEDALLLDAPEDRPGRFRILRGRAEMAAWLKDVLLNRIDVEDPEEAVHRIVTSPDALALLANDPDGDILLQAVELRRRRTGLAELRAVVDDPDATEHQLQRALQREAWIFGGQYVGISEHRRLVSGDELDIPLLRADGTLCVVELKRAQLAVLKRHRGSWIANRHVTDAVAQAVNYLCALDESRDQILTQFGIDARRANAVVLVGHPDAHEEATEAEIGEVLRLYNSHHARVEVRTYKQLLDDAENALSYREA